MDPESSLQDLVRCHACENNVSPLHCDFCQKNLCQNCTEGHLQDETMQHNIVLFKRRKLPPIYPMCQNMATNNLNVTVSLVTFLSAQYVLYKPITKGTNLFHVKSI